MAIINKGKLKLSEVVLQQSNNNWPTAQVTLTSDIVEAASNLYFTNARVYSNVLALLPTLAGSGIAIQANGQISASGGTVTFGSISQYLTTSNVSEGTNLYYTNARVLSALTGNVTVGNLTATSIVINTSVANSYTTAGNVNAGNVIATSIVIGTSVANSYTTTGNVTAGNVIATVHQGNIWVGIYTANVSESNSNLYYTNARVSSNVIGLLPSLAGSGISVQANGQISANIVGITVAATQSITIATATTTYTMSRSVADPASILVINEGLIQIPTTDYTVSGTTLTTTTQYPVGSNLEIRYFGTTSSIVTTTVVSGVNPLSFMLSGL